MGDIVDGEKNGYSTAMWNDDTYIYALEIWPGVDKEVIMGFIEEVKNAGED